MKGFIFTAAIAAACLLPAGCNTSRRPELDPNRPLTMEEFRELQAWLRANPDRVSETEGIVNPERPFNEP